MRTPGILGRDRRGAVAILAAVSMTALIGMGSFAIDLGAAYAQRARLQQVADSAAMAGAISWVKTGSATAVATTVQDLVLANGWPASTIQSSAAPTTKSPNVTVSLAAPFALTLGGVLLPHGSLQTRGYAVASVKTATTPTCLLALSNLIIESYINVNGCTAEADSSSSNAITMNSGGSLTATTISTPGSISYGGGTITGTVKTGAAAAADPYSADQSLAASGFSNCQNWSGQTTIAPGCWSNVSVNSGQTLTLNAGTGSGVFFFPSINLNGGSIVGSGAVTMVVQNQLSTGSNITLTAPNSGPWDGVALYAMQGVNFNSNVNYAINGAVYSPTGTVNLDSGTWNQSACTYIVGQTIQVNSSAKLTLPQTNCGSDNYTAPSMPGGSKIALLQ